MNGRFYVDAETEEPHIHKHGIDEDEVVDVLTNPEKIVRAGKGRGWPLVKPEQDGIFESFTSLIQNPTVSS